MTRTHKAFNRNNYKYIVTQYHPRNKSLPTFYCTTQKAVQEATGISRATIHRMLKDGKARVKNKIKYDIRRCCVPIFSSKPKKPPPPPSIVHVIIPSSPSNLATKGRRRCNSI